MANLFKTRFVPNPDGTDSDTTITNANTAFVHTYIGDDFTGNGTREFPFKSVYKANQKSGVSYIVFRGVINEAGSIYKNIIGDDINQQIITENYSCKFFSTTSLTISKEIFDNNDYSWHLRNLCIIKNQNISTDTGELYGFLVKNTFYTIGGNKLSSNWDYNFKNVTIASYSHGKSIISNCLIVSNFVTNGYLSTPIAYTVFSSNCIFKYFTTVITPAWTNDSKANVQLLRNAYLAAGMSSTNVDLLFAKDSFGNETCRIVKEARNGGTAANVFNRYDGSGNVLDFSLNPDSANEALYASDTGSYVGCFKPSSPVSSVSGNTLSSPINVLVDGSDDSNAGDLILNTADVLSFNTGSAQIWNRIKSANTIVIPNGIKFNGTNSMSTDGSPFGYYFGKYQILMDATPLNPGDALEQNTIYKVHNTTRTIYEAILYDGNQYLPDYFFKTGTTPLVFSLLNSGSGSVVKKVLSTPLESIEVIPYDDVTTPSATFPRFSSPMFGNCLMLFHKIGVNIDLPVLFSEITNDKIAYYDDWAVTNADAEFVTLAADTTNYYYKLPVLKYLRLELNGHFNVDYDQ